MRNTLGTEREDMAGEDSVPKVCRKLIFSEEHSEFNANKQDMEEEEMETTVTHFTGNIDAHPSRDSDVLLKCLSHGTGIQTSYFRTETQRKAMKCCLERSSDILYVDRTGGGKTAVVFGPCEIELGVTVVVVPLAPLRSDMRKEARHLRIPNVDFREFQNFADGVPLQGILFCSPEDVMYRSEEYVAGVKMLHKMGALNRIVVDVAHLTYTFDHYRQSMCAMKRLRPKGVDVPLMMMSATVTKNMETEVIVTHGCDVSNVHVIRGCLRRPNVGISIDHLKDGDEGTLPNATVEKSIGYIYNTKMSLRKHILILLSREQCEVRYERLRMHPALSPETATILRHYGDMTIPEKENAISI